jgi:2-dehydropantoate 2-reductase
VLGAGAIGCLYAHELHRSDCNTSLILRNATEKKSVALIVVERDGVHSERHLSVGNAENPEPISHLLVTTKAFDVRAAVAGIAHRLDKHSVVVLLVNGMGLADQLTEDYPHLQLYRGTTTEGAYRIAPLHIRHAGRGETRIGRQGQEVPPRWFEAWNHAIANSHWDGNIESALWSKLAVNCIINPLTAVHRCPNGELAKREDFADHVAALCDEVGLICRAAGHTDLAALLPQTVASVISQTAGNRSSMLQDAEHSRQTEIDYINGFLLQVAHQLGIDAPLNRALVQSVKNLDH